MDEEILLKLEPYKQIYNELVKERILFLCSGIEVSMASTICAYLLSFSKASPTEEITFYINSPGGDILDGLITIYDTMQAIPNPIKTICIGEASSSAAVILMSGNKGQRFAYPHARIMIHGVQSEINGVSEDEIKKEFKLNKKLNNWLRETMARHTGQTLAKIKRDSKEDKFFTAEEAIKYGIIDAIVPPTKEIPLLIK